MVFEILGVNLLEVLKRYEYKGVPLNLAREISRQVLIGLDFLHRICKVIHTDLKPENVLLCLTED
jgi:serine/threonine-protein kinase SRPK3